MIRVIHEACMWPFRIVRCKSMECLEVLYACEIVIESLAAACASCLPGVPQWRLPSDLMRRQLSLASHMHKSTSFWKHHQTFAVNIPYHPPRDLVQTPLSDK